jgi:hypothetical protein
MSEKRIGTLIYDPSMGRFDIRFGIESYYGGLHCGECFDVKVKDGFRFGLKWMKTGIW